VRQIYIEELAQSFVNDENVFLKMSVTDGDVDAAGTDIKVCPVTLIIPISRFSEFVDNVAVAGQNYNIVNAQEPRKEVAEDSSSLGAPLPIPK
jgi:hypothetical protein